MKKWTVIFYRQYGKWSCVMPIHDRDAAERHADRYLRDNSIVDSSGCVLTANTNAHIEDIVFVEVELPE